MRLDRWPQKTLWGPKLIHTAPWVELPLDFKSGQGKAWACLKCMKICHLLSALSFWIMRANQDHSHAHTRSSHTWILNLPHWCHVSAATPTSVWRGEGGREVFRAMPKRKLFSQENVPNNINEICVVIFSGQGHINQVSTKLRQLVSNQGRQYN